MLYTTRWHVFSPVVICYSIHIPKRERTRFYVEFHALISYFFRQTTHVVHLEKVKIICIRICVYVVSVMVLTEIAAR